MFTRWEFLYGETATWRLHNAPCPFLTFKSGGGATLWILNEETDTIHTEKTGLMKEKNQNWRKFENPNWFNAQCTFKKTPHCSNSLYSMVNEPKQQHFRGGRILLQYGLWVSRSVNYDNYINYNTPMKIIWTTFWGQNELGWAKKYTIPELYWSIFQL